MSIQTWFPLGWTGWISLQSKGLSRVFCSPTIEKHQFFSTQPSLRSSSDICAWLLEKPSVQSSNSLTSNSLRSHGPGSMPGFPIHYQLPELTQTHVHQVGDTIQPSHPLLSPSPPTFNLSQHQALFKWVTSSHEVGKVLEFQLQHQSLQWIFRTNFL